MTNDQLINDEEIKQFPNVSNPNWNLFNYLIGNFFVILVWSLVILTGKNSNDQLINDEINLNFQYPIGYFNIGHYFVILVWSFGF